MSDSPEPAVDPQLAAFDSALLKALAAGFAVSFAGWAAFGFVADRVFRSETILHLDARAQELAIEAHRPGLTKIVIVVTELGNGGTLAAITAVAGAALLYKKSHRRLYALLATMIGGGLLNAALKTVFHRARPFQTPALIPTGSYSFPSGHAMGTMLLCASLGYVAWFSTKSGALRGGIVLLAASSVATIGATRVYLGVHYLSDVLAGFACGLGWGALCFTATEGWVHARDRLRAAAKRRRLARAIGAR